jgi:hypothetical protein
LFGNNHLKIQSTIIIICFSSLSLGILLFNYVK